jgi:hypothetical protein
MSMTRRNTDLWKIRDIIFSEDWATGIGGGLWSTAWPGLTLAHHTPTIQRLQAQNEHKVDKDRFEPGGGFRPSSMALTRLPFANCRRMRKTICHDSSNADSNIISFAETKDQVDTCWNTCGANSNRQIRTLLPKA